MHAYRPQAQRRDVNVMRGFSSTFLLFFYQIALGGLFALAGTPFHEIERAFYKSTAGVLYVIALLGLWGKSALYIDQISIGLSLSVGLEIVLHVAFLAAFSSYMASLWMERQSFRARSFAASVLTGLAGLIVSAHSFYQAPLISIETVIYPASFFLSALLLGSVTIGMLIGHWYLIDTGQSLEPFIRIFRFFVMTLIAQCIFFSARPRCGCRDRHAAERRCLSDRIRAALHFAHAPRPGWPGCSADSFVDDLAHLADPAHHGSHRLVLHSSARSFRRRNLGPSNPGSDDAAVLSGNSSTLGRFSVW